MLLSLLAVPPESPVIGLTTPVTPFIIFSTLKAGKTGTTQNNSDGWFLGHTPDLVVGVWVGAEDRSVHFKTTASGQGANTALPIWGYFMKNVYKDKKIKINKGDFIPPVEGLSTTVECSYQTQDVNNPWY